MVIIMKIQVNREAKILRVKQLEKQLTQTAVQKSTPDNNQPKSLRALLKQQCPDTKFHVFNTNTPNWGRNDYPFEKFYEDNVDYEAMSNMQFSEKEPLQTDDVVQNRLNKIKPGQRAVIVDKETNRTMETDLQYAQKIIKAAQKYFKEVETTVSLKENSHICSIICVIGKDTNVVGSNSISTAYGKFIKKNDGVWNSYWESRKQRNEEYELILKKLDQKKRADAVGVENKERMSQAEKAKLAKKFQQQQFIEEGREKQDILNSQLNTGRLRSANFSTII